MMNRLTMYDFRLLRRINWVPRWVIFPSHRKQSVAEHSFGVAVIATWLMDRYHTSGSHIEFRLNVLEKCIAHDRYEGITGDQPSPTKDKPANHVDNMGQEDIVLKVADCLEAWLFLEEELRMGNNYTQSIHADLYYRLDPYWRKFQFMPIGSKFDTQQLISEVLGFMWGPNSEDHPILETYPPRDSFADEAPL